MSSKERRSVPAEAIEIYNKYVHDEIGRRVQQALIERAKTVNFCVA